MALVIQVCLYVVSATWKAEAGKSQDGLQREFKASLDNLVRSYFTIKGEKQNAGGVAGVKSAGCCTEDLSLPPVTCVLAHNQL